MNIPIENLIDKLPQGSRKLFIGAIGIVGILTIPIPEMLEPKVAAQIIMVQCACVAAISIACVVCQLLLDRQKNGEPETP